MVGAELDALRQATLNSPYVGGSPLQGTFAASRGFGLTFRRDGLAHLNARFAFLQPYLELVLPPTAHRGLWSVPERLRDWVLGLAPNAFYLNLLIVPAGAAVGPHIDATLAEPSGQSDAVPRVVSVLYLQAPPTDGGGVLRLARGAETVAHLQPEAGALLHFRGDLLHEVEKVAASVGQSASTPSTRLRASLVCEQYILGRAALERLPAFSVKSKGRFQAALRKAAAAPPKEFELD